MSHQQYRVLVTEAYTRLPGSSHHIVRRIDLLGLTKDFLDRDRDDMGRLERHHVPPLLIFHGADGRSAEPGGEQAVVPGGLATALKVPEHQGPRFLARHLL